MRSNCIRRRLRSALLVSVSVIALTVSNPEAYAGDKPSTPSFMQASPQWTWYLEGGAFWTGGGSALGFSQLRPNVGGEIAGGVDYRFGGTPWHVSAQLRYGSNKKTIGLSGAGTFYGYSGGILGSATQKESHFVADFAVGRDVGIGGGMAQAKLGIRVADLKAKTNFSGSAFTYSGSAYTVTAEFRSRFLGVGPRVSLEGSLPITGPWAIDYMGGVAVLYGNRTLDVSLIAGGISGTVSFNQYGTVFNADAMAGLSYAFSQSMKLTAGYRFDGYWNALRTFDNNFNFVDISRFYHGPFLRATVKF
jgi:Legionella pneumophila major outer membrane protein precursor